MANYSAKEHMNKFDLRGLKLPKLKGHVKITLRDLYHTRVIEGENLITDAIADILANNYVGAIDTSKILTLADQWFGGILVYEQAHTLNVSNYFIPADDDNHLWAHAGDEAPASAEIAQQDLGRGSPTNTTRTSNSITHTWEWGHSQGNSGDRYIRALACGITNTINIFQPDILCIGGGVCNEGDPLLVPLKELVKQEVYTKMLDKNTEIVIAQLGNDAGLIGAAFLGNSI